MQESTKDVRRRMLDPDRKGSVLIGIPFRLGVPMPVKNCTVCRKPCPYTTKHQFACRNCNVLFFLIF